MKELMIRPETHHDFARIAEINRLAFVGEEEVGLIERLREDSRYLSVLSLVAEEAGELIGHILFTPLEIGKHSSDHRSLALAPMSVIPERQSKGIGSRLVRAGLEKARNLGFESIVVLGHPKYYPRFGFVPAHQFGIDCPFEGVPEAAWMALELVPGGLARVSGPAKYLSAFHAS